MSRIRSRNSILLLICLFIGLAVGIYIVMKRGVPFVSQREQWSIGIYHGASPFEFPDFQGFRNPVLTAEDVTDVNAKFVADPFLLEEAGEWYMFFEVYNRDSEQGDIAVAVSSDLKKWHYDQIVLDEPFHLSYPYVFKREDDYYMIPETYETDSVRLYKAERFPTKWTFVSNMIEGISLVDSSIVYFDGKWILFSSDATDKNDVLRLFLAEKLTGPWKEHPYSPVVDGDANIARPGGRLLVHDGQLFRYTQDSDPTYGNQIWAFQITELTGSSYREKRVGNLPILKADGSGWNGHAMHNIDPLQRTNGSWVAAVDGFGNYLVWGLDY